MFYHQYNQPRRPRHFESTHEPDAFAFFRSFGLPVYGRVLGSSATQSHLRSRTARSMAQISQVLQCSQKLMQKLYCTLNYTYRYQVIGYLTSAHNHPPQAPFHRLTKKGFRERSEALVAFLWVGVRLLAVPEFSV